MAFGMSPFPLQFGSRGGGADPTALNEGRLTALGITTLRAGSAQRVNLPGGAISAYETVAANKPLWQPVTVAGRQYLALMVQDGSTPLVASSNNLSGWSTTGSPSVVYTASGGLGGGGYTTVTGTGGAWTVSKAITDASGNRGSLIRCYAPDANADPILLSQDAGSTTVAITEGSFQEVRLASQTTANPTLRVSGGGTDSVVIYDFQHGKLAAGAHPFRRHVPQGVTPAAAGATTHLVTAGSGITEVDVTLLITQPTTGSGSVAPRIFAVDNPSTSNRMIDCYLSSANKLQMFGFNAAAGIAVNHISSSTISGSDLYLIRYKYNQSVAQAWLNGVQEINVVPSGTIISETRIELGGWSSAPKIGAGLVGIRDNNGQIFGGITGFGLDAIARYEESL